MINKDNKKFIPAKDIPNNLKLTSLQLTILLSKDSNNSVLFNIPIDLFEQLENSLNILFSIPK